VPWSSDTERGFAGRQLDELLDRWVGGYDWAVHERRTHALPWKTVGADDRIGSPRHVYAWPAITVGRRLRDPMSVISVLWCERAHRRSLQDASVGVEA
jgi:hypothetical protein